MKLTKTHKIYLLVAFIALATVGAVLYIMSTAQRPAPALDLTSFSVAPTGDSPDGVLTDSGFLVSCDASFSKDDVQAILQLTPTTEYEVEKQADGQFLVKPKEALLVDTLYQFEVGNPQYQLTRTWAFQTTRPVGVLYSYPDHNSGYVNIDQSFEFTLSHSDMNIAEHFTIDPPVRGHFEHYRNVAVYVLEENLQADVTYTVTITKGMKTKTGDSVMEEDHVLKFRADDRSDRKKALNVSLVGNYSESFLTTDIPIIEFYASFLDRSQDALDVSINIYTLKDHKAYTGILQEYSNYENTSIGRKNSYRYDVSSLGAPKVLEGKILHAENTGSKMITFPQTLAPGYYVAQATLEKDGQTTTVQKLLQISDTSVYIQLHAENQAFMWLNDAATGKPLANATVEFASDGSFTQVFTSQSDAQGVVQAKAPDKGDVYFRIKNGDNILYADTILMRERSYDRSPNMEQDYYTMIYTDRSIYQPTDKVQFWGFITPRTAQRQMPTTLQLQLRPDYSSEATQTLTVPINKDGSFAVSLELENMSSGWHNVALADPVALRQAKMDGIDTVDSPYQARRQSEYATTSVYVSAYQKPSYVVTNKPQQLYYEENQPIAVDIDASFFEGTPAIGLGFTIDGGGTGTTDINGKTTLTTTAKTNEEYPQYTPYTHWYYANSTSAEDQSYDTSGVATIIPRNVLVFTKDDGKTVTVTTKNVDYDKIATLANYWDVSAQSLAGTPVDLPLKVQRIRVDIIRTQNGSRYDYINKETLPIYEYSQRETLEEERNLATVNGMLEITDMPLENTDDYYYYLKITGSDLSNRFFAYTHVPSGISNHQRLLSDNGTKVYKFCADLPDGRSDFTTSTYLAEGESARMRFYANDMLVENKGTILYIISQNNVLSHGFTQNAAEDITLEAPMLPNAIFTPVYFDGKHVYPMQPTNLHLDTPSKELAVTITPSQEAYQPGDTVKAQVSIKDAAGKPVQGTVNVSVSDEAVFAIAEQNYNAVEDLYSSIWYVDIKKYSSYVQYDPTLGQNLDTGGGMGGGGGDGAQPRQKFVDTAYFHNLATNAQGVANIEFTLPDNLTSWRLTAVAISDKGTGGGKYLAGDQTANVAVRIPFFVQPILSSRYLLTDDVALTARVRSGDSIDYTQVQYSAKLLDAEGKELPNTATASGELGLLNFGKLPAGSYQVIVTAQYGQLTDAMQLPFVVSQNALELPVQETFDLSKGITVDALRYPVTVQFYDAQYSTYAKAINVLLGASGRRIDQRLPLAYAQKAMAASGSLPQGQLLTDSDLTELHQSGLIPLFNQAEGDALLTGKIALAAPDYIDPAGIIPSLQRVLTNKDSTPQDIIGAYLGLAALKAPVLPELQALVNDQSLTLEERLYVIAALGSIGDTLAANTAYQTYVSPLLTRENSWAYLPTPEEDGKEATFDYTRVALLAATAVNSPDAHLLAEYLCANPSSKNLANLELMTYTQKFAPKAGTTAKFSYTSADGTKKIIDLGTAPLHSASFSKQQLEKASFKVLSGQVGATVLYIGKGSDATLAPIEGLTISKSMLNAQTGAEAFAIGDLVTVTIAVQFDPTAPEGYYPVTDLVPAGMRYAGLIDNRYNVDPNWHLQSMEGQSLYFGLYHRLRKDDDPHWGYEGNADATEGSPNVDTSPEGNIYTYYITYKARCVLPGTYGADGAYITRSDTGDMMTTGPIVATIAP